MLTVIISSSAACMQSSTLPVSVLLFTFANSLDPNQTQQNVGQAHNLDPNYLILLCVGIFFWKKLIYAITLILFIFFVPKMLSAYYVCCIYSNPVLSRGKTNLVNIS